MKMSRSDQRKYPRCTQYIKHQLPQVIQVPVIVQAMKRCGQLTMAQFRVALAWGTHPTIRVVALPGACAQFYPRPGNHVIEISPGVMKNHEAGRGLLTTGTGRTVAALGVNILHEMVHWGDNADGADRPGESGDEFEQLVYRINLGC